MQVLYWCQDTAAVPFETGIQRVTRRLAQGLQAHGAAVLPIGWNADRRRVEVLPASRQHGGRPLEAVAGRDARNTIVVVPEIALSLVQADLDPVQLASAYGLRTAALVHDLIPMKLAADYTPDTVAMYRRYYRQFASADVALATSYYVAGDLQNHLAGEGLRVPPVVVTHLPAEFPGLPRRRATAPPLGPGEALRLVTVTSWEPRKNLMRLLEAVHHLSERGVALSLDLVGRQGSFPAYDREVLALAEAMPNVAVRGTLSDVELAALYAGCHASVYPSLEEGFGLPIGESLWFGRPCLCHLGSAMAEVAPGGGTMLVDMADAAAIAAALRRLAREDGLLVTLAQQAVARDLRTWDDYAGEVLAQLDVSR